MAFFDTIAARLNQRAAYKRTRRELENLPLESRIDLGLNGLERDVARRAVYG